MKMIVASIALCGALLIAMPAAALSIAHEPYYYDYYSYYQPIGYGYGSYGTYSTYDYYSYYNYYQQPSYQYQPTYYQQPYQYTYDYGYSTPSPHNYSYPTGDRDALGNDLCFWEGYGRSSCDFNPRQPVYDYYTGTWY